MKANASLLFVSLVALLLVTTCVTAAFWTRTEERQVNQYLNGTPQSVTSELRVLLLQSAAPANATQPSRASSAENITRIIVPISKVENTSSSGAQPFSGFELPSWFWILIILVLLVILAYLFLKLLRDSDNEPPLEKQPPAPASTSEARGDQPRQIPIDQSESEAERKRSSLAESKIRSIPIDASEEQREFDEDPR